VKVADFGLARKVNEGDAYYARSIDSQHPVRWSAPESFPPTSRVSLRSDVWSFGIVLFELFEFCKTDPYPELSTSKVKQKLEAETKEDMSKYLQIRDCPDSIQQLLNDCLLNDSHSRPTFSKIVNILETMKEKIRLTNQWKYPDQDKEELLDTDYKD